MASIVFSPSIVDWYSWLVAVVITGIVYLAASVGRRIFFHPLSKFPGPKLAAATFLYEAYFDVILSGQYTFKIDELHKRYGTFLQFRSQRFV